MPLATALAGLVVAGIAWRVIVWWVIGHANLVYFASDTNAFMLLAGCLLAILLVEGREPEISPVVGWLAIGGRGVSI